MPTNTRATGKSDEAKSTRETTDENKERIIEYIRSHPMYYDAKNPSYKWSKVRKVEKLGKECGVELKPPMTGDQVLNIWNSLRRQYRTNLARYKDSFRSGAASQGKNKKVWKFFASLRWLDDYIESVEEVNSVKQPHLEPTSSKDCSHQFESIEDDSWAKQCALCNVFRCDSCKVFCSIENGDEGRMREHTLKCFAAGDSQSNTGHQLSSTLDDERFSRTDDLKALTTEPAESFMAETNDGATVLCAVLQSPVKKKPKSDRPLPSSENKQVLRSLVSCLDKITSNCASAKTNQTPATQPVELKSPNRLFCDALELKLDRIYCPEKHGDDNDARYCALEDLKIEIDQLVNASLKNITKECK